MSLQELYGLPPVIRTPYATRQHPDCQHPRKQVCCPNGHGWQDLAHNSYCHDCALWLVEQPAAVVTEPAVVETAEQVQEGIEHYKNVLAQWDADCEAEPTVAQVAARIDSALAVVDAALQAEPEQPIASIETSEDAAEVEPMDEQSVLIAELAAALESDEQPDRERYFAARSGKYVLLHQRSDGLAVGCSCPSRVKKLRFQGKACKHMTAHNDMLTPATQQQQAA